MFKASFAKKLERLLREFPWLWAIRSDWDPRIVEVRVRYAHEVEELWRGRSLLDEHFLVWVHLKNTADRERVIPLGKSGSGRLTLARQVYLTGTLEDGLCIQHVVIMLGNTIDIFREPGCGQVPICSFERFLTKGGLF